MRYKAFISYKHSSLGFSHAESLVKSLKIYAKPLLKKPYKIFLDEKILIPGMDLSQKIKKALGESEYLLFLAEEESASSLWCQKELEYWCNTLGRKDYLIIIYLKGALSFDIENDMIIWNETKALPIILKPYTNNKIPFWLDLSWASNIEDIGLHNSKYKEVINKISAAFQSKDPEELNDEEIRIYRRNNRLKNATIITLLFAFILSLITTIYALNRNEYAQKKAIDEENQRKRAELSLINSYQFQISKLQSDSIELKRIMNLAKRAEEMNHYGLYKIKLDSVTSRIHSLQDSIVQLKTKL